jgi:hypothetical protein
MKKNKNIVIFCLVSLIIGCSKNVTVNVPPPTPQLVIEGHIEPNGLGYAYVSHNFAFFGTTTVASILQQDVVHGALITVNDGFTTDSMKEYIPSLGLYRLQHMTGVTGRTYQLKVVVNGQTLTSSTTILPAVPLDSSWFQVQPGKDSLGYMWATFHDPPQPGNCYRWMTERLGKDTLFVAPDESAFDDDVINGQVFEFYFERGVQPDSKNLDDMNGERHYYKTGEHVVVKFCSIENIAFQFYSQYYFQLGNSGNPFGSPAPLPGNIKGGLGIWCAYGTYLDTVICK